MRTIDLRSDTITQPTAEMRQAMACAVVGDDEYREDPSIRTLEETAASLLGKESALFLTSGTMANLVALMVHCDRDGGVVAGALSHVVRVERGISSVARLRVTSVTERIGIGMEAATLRETLSTAQRNGRLVVSVENTHSYCGGAPLNAEQTQSLAAIAREARAAFHIDGARLFNAQVATRSSVADLAREADSVCFCLSKGLSAPMGSLLCGSREFIAQARTTRALVGGNLRQAGVVAAAGLTALQTMLTRLEVDHELAALLARGMTELGYEVDHPVKTNMVYIHVPEARSMATRLEAAGIRAMALHENRLRFVTHSGLEEADIQEMLTRLERLSSGGPPPTKP